MSDQRSRHLQVSSAPEQWLHHPQQRPCILHRDMWQQAQHTTARPQYPRETASCEHEESTFLVDTPITLFGQGYASIPSLANLRERIPRDTCTQLQTGNCASPSEQQCPASGPYDTDDFHRQLFLDLEPCPFQASHVHNPSQNHVFGSPEKENLGKAFFDTHGSRQPGLDAYPFASALKDCYGHIDRNFGVEVSV